jgi:protein gp37
MGETTGISWTHATFNPWWGCTRVSPGCEHCYAEQLATVRRKLDVWGVDASRKSMSEAYWREPAKWNRKAAAAGERLRVFCASMADVFELLPERNVAGRATQDEARARLWPLIESTPWLDWLLLTKRPQNVYRLVPWGLHVWPSNVWLGVTAEDQRRAEERIPMLLSLPAAVRFVSHEPALGPIDLWAFLKGPVRDASLDALMARPMPGVDWIITGGESGPGARPYDLAWARSVVDQCRTAGVAPFVKQLGANPIMSPGPITWPTSDRKGGDLAEWPADLRVQEFPLSPSREHREAPHQVEMQRTR